MTIEQLERAHGTTPFRPYRVQMADGQQYPTPHPDYLSLSPVGRTAMIFHDDGSASIVDLLLMTELELAPVGSQN